MPRATDRKFLCLLFIICFVFDPLIPLHKSLLSLPFLFLFPTYSHAFFLVFDGVHPFFILENFFLLHGKGVANLCDEAATSRGFAAAFLHPFHGRVVVGILGILSFVKQTRTIVLMSAAYAAGDGWVGVFRMLVFCVISDFCDFIFIQKMNGWEDMTVDKWFFANEGFWKFPLLGQDVVVAGSAVLFAGVLGMMADVLWQYRSKTDRVEWPWMRIVLGENTVNVIFVVLMGVMFATQQLPFNSLAHQACGVLMLVAYRDSHTQDESPFLSTFFQLFPFVLAAPMALQWYKMEKNVLADSWWFLPLLFSVLGQFSGASFLCLLPSRVALTLILPCLSGASQFVSGQAWFTAFPSPPRPHLIQELWRSLALISIQIAVLIQLNQTDQDERFVTSSNQRIVDHFTKQKEELSQKARASTLVRNAMRLAFPENPFHDAATEARVNDVANRLGGFRFLASQRNVSEGLVPVRGGLVPGSSLLLAGQVPRCVKLAKFSLHGGNVIVVSVPNLGGVLNNDSDLAELMKIVCEASELPRLDSLTTTEGFCWTPCAFVVHNLTRPNSTTLHDVALELGARGGLRLDWRIFKPLATNIADALSFLHNSNVLHRNITSTSILLTGKDSVCLPPVSFLHVFPEVKKKLWGQPAYWTVAPEAKIGPHAYTTASEVWAVCALTWEMIVGPLSATEGFVSPLAIPPTVPKHVVSVLVDGLSINPDARPSMLELYQAFSQVDPISIDSSADSAKLFSEIILRLQKHDEKEVLKETDVINLARKPRVTFSGVISDSARSGSGVE